MIRKRATATLAAVAAVALNFSALAQAQTQLPRRASLGVGMNPAAQTGPGARVTEVAPGGTADRIGLRPGDLIVQVGDKPVGESAAVVQYARGLIGGAPVSMVVQRGGKRLRLRGRAMERPREAYRGATVDYGAVPFRGGLIRDILISPTAARDAPVVFLLPGFSCASIEPPDPGHSYRRLGELLLRQGIGYYRAEKPGMGDSSGGPRCEQIDYATELDAFRHAYRHLVTVRGVAPERIFMFGHSLGGLQAPMLASEVAPRGIAIYGAVLRNWADYHRNVAQFQSFLMEGEDPVAETASAEALRPILQQFYHQRRAPSEIAAQGEQAATSLRNNFAWDGGDNMFGRHYRYNQDLAGLNLVKAWRDSPTRVLSIYGESDLVALFDEDHRLVADIVNHYRPGSGRFAILQGSGHGMDLIGSREEVREKTRAAGQPPQGEFNPEMARLLGGWVRQSMASPPVNAGHRARAN